MLLDLFCGMAGQDELLLVEVLSNNFLNLGHELPA
jgi:hypothetical protein